MNGPKTGEYWTIGCIENLEIICIARNWIGEKFFVFKEHKNVNNAHFIISKDEFYSNDIRKFKQSGLIC